MKTILILLALTLQAVAQLNVSIKPTKKQFVAHEDVTLTLSITNRAGRTVTLQGKQMINWLNLNIYDQNRSMLPYREKAPNYKALVIPAGGTSTKTLNISDWYDLSRYGNYSITADVSLPGNTNDAVRSNSSRFTITNGRVLATQKIGMAGTASARKYEVIKFNGDSKTDIYVKITNDYTQQVMSCKAISQTIPYKEPKIALDSSNNLHLLYLITHQTYVHHVIAPTGKISKRSYHKPGAYGDPRLIAFAKGDVKVAGSIPFDPVKAKKEALENRQLSDRPNF